MRDGTVVGISGPRDISRVVRREMILDCGIIGL